MLLRRVAERVYQAWLLLQVELYGTYSVPRLLELKKHNARKFSPCLTVATLWLTVLPSILVVVVMDLPRLASPSDGLENSQVFWSRAFITAGLIAFTLLQQMRCLLPSLGVTQTQITAVALLVASSSISFVIGLSSVVGFPLPFSAICNGPVFLVTIISSGIYLWGKRIYYSQRLRFELRQVVSIIMVQWALTLIYPIFNFIFSELDAVGQTLFATVLVAVKMLLKYWLARCMENLPDLQPGFVIFNVEVFHSLFVACCMQNATSSLTTATLMVMDALHGWISIHDVNSLLDGLTRTLHRHEEIKPRANDVAPRSIPLVDSAIYLLQDPATARLVTAGLSTATRKSRRKISKDTVDATQHTGQSQPHAKHLVAVYPMSAPVMKQSWITEPDAVSAIQSELSTTLNENQTQLLDSLPLDQRVSYVRQVLALLHVIEFLLLIEYVEVVIPIIYSVYIVVVFHLPNRVFYPQIHAMTASSLARVVSNELLYAALEFISFLLLDGILRRKVHFHPSRQLAFVLRMQWQVIQAKLILWVVYMVQTSLVHFGADYTFQFRWLHNTTYFD